MKLRNRRTIVVKDYSKLEKYGFEKKGDSYYFFTGNKDKYGNSVWSILFNSKKKSSCISSGNITLEIICKLYKDGIISFENSNSVENVIARKENKIQELEDEIRQLKGEIENE